MAAWGYELYLLVLKVSLEDKIRIPSRPCNILYVKPIKTLSVLIRTQIIAKTPGLND